jgi:diguanylate cyclase (GGDEF)-like protein
MFDVRSIYIVMVMTNLVLAASLWAGSGPRSREGLGYWTAGLVAQAMSFAMFSARAETPEWLSVVVASSLLAVSLSLYAAAILEFRGKSLPDVLHPTVGILAAIVFTMLLDDLTIRVIVAGLLFSAATAELVALAWTPMHDVSPTTRTLLLGSFAAVSLSFLGRAVAALQNPVYVETFQTTSMMQASMLLVGHSAILMASVAFLLMHKERADHAAQQLASIDPLTGAFNRRTFIELAEKELSRSRRMDVPLSLIMLDLDHFKIINDTHGHVVGDRVLQRFAEIVRAELRKEDILVRYGGEEFCVLLPDVPGPGAVTLAGRIRKSVSKQAFDVGEQPVAVTVSAGVAARIDEGPEGLDRLISRADEALYVAKNRGRDRVAAISLGKSRVA